MFEPNGPEPTHIGRYLVTGEVGRSPFVTVHRAVDDQLSRPIAIKLLDPEATANPGMRARFVLEGHQLRTVASGALVGLHDTDELDTGQPYLVLELADRGDLRTRVEQRRLLRHPVTPDDALVVAEALVTALAPMHAAHIVHRHLTASDLLIFSGAADGPADGLLFSGEELKLADLGLARDLAELAGFNRGGPQGHLPPEQRDAFGIVDHRVDVYGASAVVFWVITGTQPGLSMEHNRAVLARSACVGPLQAALITGLTDTPDRRQATIEDWYADLAGLAQAHRPVPTDGFGTTIDLVDHRPVGHPVPAARGPLAVTGRRRLALAALTAALLLVATAIAIAVPLRLRDRGASVGTEAADTTVPAAMATSGQAAGPPTTPAVAPTTAEPLGLPAPLPPEATTATPGPAETTLPMATPAPTVTPSATVAPSRRATVPPAVARISTTSSTSSTAAAGGGTSNQASTSSTTAPVAAAGSTGSTSTSAGPAVSSTTLPASAVRVSTVCGALVVVASDAAGWRNVEWIPSSAWTDRALGYLNEPWWPEADGAVSVHAPGPSFTVAVRCRDGAGANLSQSVTVV